MSMAGGSGSTIPADGTRPAKGRRSVFGDVLGPELRPFLDEAGHERDAVRVVGDDHLDAAFAEERLVAAEGRVLGDDDPGMPNWTMAPEHIMQGESEV